MESLLSLWNSDVLVSQMLAAYRDWHSEVSSATFSNPNNLFLTTVVLLVSTLSVMAFSSPCFRRSSRKAGKTKDYRSSQRALLHLICPARGSTWPTSYVALVKRSRGAVVVIPVETLMRDVISGVVEFRNIHEDLPGLLNSSNRVMELHVGMGLRSSVMRWLFVSQMPHIAYQAAPLAARLPERDRLPSSLFRSGPVDFELTLDAVPSAHLESFIRTLQAVCARDKTVVIHFTTLGHLIRLWSKEFVLTALPFLPRRYPGRSTKDVKPSVCPPQPSSLCLSTPMHQIIEHLTSGNSPFCVASLTDISADYSDRLNAHSRDIETNAGLRELDIGSLGLEELRQEQLMLSWQSGLYAGKYLSRWVVVLKK